MFSDREVWLIICDLSCNGRRCRLGMPAVRVRRVISAQHRTEEVRPWPWETTPPDIQTTPWWIEFKEVDGLFPALAVRAPQAFTKENVFAVPPLLLGWARRHGFKGFALDGNDIIPLWEPTPDRKDPSRVVTRAHEQEANHP